MENTVTQYCTEQELLKKQSKYQNLYNEIEVKVPYANIKHIEAYNSRGEFIEKFISIYYNYIGFKGVVTHDLILNDLINNDIEDVKLSDFLMGRDELVHFFFDDEFLFMCRRVMSKMLDRYNIQLVPVLELHEEALESSKKDGVDPFRFSNWLLKGFRIRLAGDLNEKDFRQLQNFEVLHFARQAFLLDCLIRIARDLLDKPTQRFDKINNDL